MVSIHSIYCSFNWNKEHTLYSPVLVQSCKAIERFSFAANPKCLWTSLIWEGNNSFYTAFISKYQFKCIVVAIQLLLLRVWATEFHFERQDQQPWRTVLHMLKSPFTFTSQNDSLQSRKQLTDTCPLTPSLRFEGITHSPYMCFLFNHWT